MYLSAAAYLGYGKKPEVLGPQGKHVDPKIGEDPAKLFEEWKHTGGMIQ